MSIANLFSDDGNVIPMETQTWNALALSEGFQPNTVVLSNETGYLGSINSKSTTLNAPELLFNSNSVIVVPDDYNANAFQVVDQNGSNLFNVNNSTPDEISNPSVKIGNASIVITGYEGSITDYELLTVAGGGGGSDDVIASQPMTAGYLAVGTDSLSVTTNDKLSAITHSLGSFVFHDIGNSVIPMITITANGDETSNVNISTLLSINNGFNCTGDVNINDTNGVNVMKIVDHGNSTTGIITYAPIYTEGDILPISALSSIGDSANYYSNAYINSIATSGLVAQNNNYMIFSGGDTVIANHVRALNDGGSACGTPANRWSAVYAINGSIQTSSEKMKTNVKKSDLGLDFIKKLKPKSWEWVNDEITIHKTKSGNNRVNHGFIFQDIEKENPEFGGLFHGQTDEEHGLAYSSFIAPMVKAIQELTAKVDYLEKQLRN